MPRSRLPLRFVLFAALALAAALLLGLVVMTLNGLLEFYQRLVDLPLWLRIPLLAAVAAFTGGVGWLLWRLARPARHPAAAPVAPPVSRADVDTRIDHLRERAVRSEEHTSELQSPVHLV